MSRNKAMNATATTMFAIGVILILIGLLLQGGTLLAIGMALIIIAIIVFAIRLLTGKS